MSKIYDDIVERRSVMVREISRKEYRARNYQTKFKATREEGSNDCYIEGYFSVFNSIYDLWPGATESIAPGAFSETLGNDIKALTNHDSTLVLGRNKSNTLELKEDSHGLWARIKLNADDQDAMNLYARVHRGDVDQCSFGFNVLKEDVDYKDDSVHWTIEKVDLHEVSVVTFPAYEDTSVTAREKDFEVIRQRQREVDKQNLIKKLEGIKC